MFRVHLGDDDAGEEMRVVTAGEHHVAPDRRPFLLAVGALVIAVLAGIGFFVASGDPDPVVAGPSTTGQTQTPGTDSGATSSDDLTLARLATVQIIGLDRRGNASFTGSGALVDPSGIILTNAHVAYPRSYDQRTGFPDPFPFDPEEFEVRFVSEDGGAADIMYRGVPLELHPGHDAALIQVVAAADGGPVGELPAAPLSLGTIADLRAGDQVAVIGYPGQAFTDRVSVAITNFQSFAACGPSGVDPFDRCTEDYDPGWLNLANETLGGGSSGGPIVRNGVIVGIQQGVIFGEATGDVSDQEQAVPIDIAVDGLAGI